MKKNYVKNATNRLKKVLLCRYCQVNFQGFIKSQTKFILFHTTDSTWVISCQSFRRLSTKTLKVFAETKCRSNLKQS